MSSNGKGAHHPPPIDPEIQRLLDRHRAHKESEDEIRGAIALAVASLLERFRDDHERIAGILEGYAQRIRSDLEAKKRDQRQRGE